MYVQTSISVFLFFRLPTVWNVHFEPRLQAKSPKPLFCLQREKPQFWLVSQFAKLYFPPEVLRLVSFSSTMKYLMSQKKKIIYIYIFVHPFRQLNKEIFDDVLSIPTTDLSVYIIDVVKRKKKGKISWARWNDDLNTFCLAFTFCAMNINQKMPVLGKVC